MDGANSPSGHHGPLNKRQEAASQARTQNIGGHAHSHLQNLWLWF